MCFLFFAEKWWETEEALKGKEGGKMREKGLEERGPKAHSKNSDFGTPMIEVLFSGFPGDAFLPLPAKFARFLAAPRSSRVVGQPAKGLLFLFEKFLQRVDM